MFAKKLLLIGTLLLRFWNYVEANNIFDHNEVIFEGIPAQAPANITVGAYYYPWHYSHFQVNIDGYIRKELEPRQEIRLGEYDDRVPAVIQQHLEWSKRANIGVWVTSWWGPNSGEDSTLREVILDPNKVTLGDHKFALLYETTGRIRESEGYDVNARLPDDFDYICKEQKYFDHPSYYRINGRPVLVIYLTRLLDGKELLDDVIPLIRERCPSVYIVGDQVWGSPPAKTLDLLDSVTNYDIYGNMGRPRYARQEGVDRYYRRARGWKEYAAFHNSTFVPSVAPGYNDRGVRLQNENPALSRRLDEDSKEGSLFAAQISAAVQLLDPEADNFLLVNSFNEWHEDTQIEPCDGKTATEPFVMTQGLEYKGYGTLYLDILATYTSKTPQLSSSQPLPVKFSGPLYAQAKLAAYYWSWHKEENFAEGVRAGLDPPQSSVFGKATDNIRQDLLFSWEANITTWILPWSQPVPDKSDEGAQRLFQDDFLFSSGHELGIHYNLINRIQFIGDSVDVTNVRSDINYLCQNYFKTSNYLSTVSGKPIVFLGRTRVLSSEQLSAVTGAIRSEASLGTCQTELFLVGDEVWGPAKAAQQSKLTSLDAVMNNDVFGNLGGPSGYPGSALLGDYFEQQRLWRLAAWQSETSYVPTVIPGFNDRAIRGDRNHAMSRRIEPGAAEGTWFEESLDKAEHLLDSELHDLIIVNSLNHFAEDTQIYPVCGADTSLPSFLTQGLGYDAYGLLYVEILRDKFGSYQFGDSEGFPDACGVSIASAQPNDPAAFDSPFLTPQEPGGSFSVPVNSASPTLAPTGPAATRTTSSAPTLIPTPLPTRMPTVSPTTVPTTVEETGPCVDDETFRTRGGKTCSDITKGRRCKRWTDAESGRLASEMCVVKCGICVPTSPAVVGPVVTVDQPSTRAVCTFLGADSWRNVKGQTCEDIQSLQVLGIRRGVRRSCRNSGTVTETGTKMTGNEACGLACLPECQGV